MRNVVRFVGVALSFALWGAPLSAQAGEPSVPLEARTPVAGGPRATEASDASCSVVLTFYYGGGCPHCQEARPFVQRLADEHDELTVEWVEVQRDARGQARFFRDMQRLGVLGAGIPTFVVGDEYVVGFIPGSTEARVRTMVGRALSGGGGSHEPTEDPRVVTLPLLGELDSRAVALPVFTLVVGLIDGVNRVQLGSDPRVV